MDNAEDILPQPQSAQQKLSNSSNLLEPLTIIVAVLLIALIAGTSGYLLGIRNEQSILPSQPIKITHTPAAITQPSTTPALHPTPEVTEASPRVAPTTDPSLTANWKMYVNDEIGISFKYPPSFGSVNKDEELCLIDRNFIREYQNQVCVGIKLQRVTASGKQSFLVAQSKLFLEHGPGRGAFWGDLSAALSEDPDMNVKSYCTNYNPLLIECSMKINSNSALYVKSLETVQTRDYPSPNTRAIYYVILNKNRNFPVIIIRAMENDNFSFEESERVFDQLLSTLKFTS
jgi:hypothetical protein